MFDYVRLLTFRLVTPGDIHSDPTQLIYFGLFSWPLLEYWPNLVFFTAAYEDNLDDVHSYWKEYFMVFHIVPKKVCNFYLLLSKVDDFSDILTRVIKSSKQPICFSFYLEPVSIVTSQALLLVYRSLLSKITRDLTRPFFLAGFLSSLARHTNRNRDYS